MSDDDDPLFAADEDDDVFAPIDDEIDVEAYDEDDHGYPVSGYRQGEPVPVLRLIPRERWREVMAPLHPATRRAAVNSAEYEDVSVALALVGELMLADAAGRAAALDAPAPAVPAGVPPERTRHASRQINFRLGPTQYERLVQAAGLFEMRPTTLARVLTVSGVDRALYEERRAREQERRAGERGRRPWPA